MFQENYLNSSRLALYAHPADSDAHIFSMKIPLAKDPAKKEYALIEVPRTPALDALLETRFAIGDHNPQVLLRIVGDQFDITLPKASRPPAREAETVSPPRDWNDPAEMDGYLKRLRSVLGEDEPTQPSAGHGREKIK